MSLEYKLQPLRALSWLRSRSGLKSLLILVPGTRLASEESCIFSDLPVCPGTHLQLW